MGSWKSQDEVKIITAALHDVFIIHGSALISIRQQANTLNKVEARCRKEGLSFLTKTLPRLGKAFDKALAGGACLNSVECRFPAMLNSKLPRFLGELFSQVLDPNGALLPNPCTKCVGSLRQVLYLFYKYELPYTVELEHQVIERFVKTEQDLTTVAVALEQIQRDLDVETATFVRRRAITPESTQLAVAREARILLAEVFASFDPHDITPRHGPGAVATKQELWEKFQWTNVSANITRTYPLDAYFYASLGHVCDSVKSFQTLGEVDLPAQVILVPKDSRGPRLISCEPVDYQWIQQGLGKAIVQYIEEHYTTKYNVFFTDQTPNRCGALLGSTTGGYVTLDLNEASDRVSTALVRLLFPEHLFRCLESCRSSATVLPNGEILKLLKFAPMGSSLCFPILALTIWSILTAAAPDADTREGILVYGDDVIVPTAFAEDAMKRLESFGLKINRDKSCISGLFRESCGADAFKGVNVTPVRFRTVWSSLPSPEVYVSYIAYANSLRRRSYYTTYEVIVGGLHHIYGAIPATDMALPCPSLDEVPEHQRPNKRRVNKDLQQSQWLVREIKSPTLDVEIEGWSMLLRFMTEAHNPRLSPASCRASSTPYGEEQAFSVRSYTRRRTSRFVRRWRSPYGVPSFAT